MVVVVSGDTMVSSGIDDVGGHRVEFPPVFSNDNDDDIRVVVVYKYIQFLQFLPFDEAKLQERYCHSARGGRVGG